jgi:hypothetical protein
MSELSFTIPLNFDSKNAKKAGITIADELVGGLKRASAMLGLGGMVRGAQTGAQLLGGAGENAKSGASAGAALAGTIGGAVAGGLTALGLGAAVGMLGAIKKSLEDFPLVVGIFKIFKLILMLLFLPLIPILKPVLMGLAKGVQAVVPLMEKLAASVGNVPTLRRILPCRNGSGRQTYACMEGNHKWRD